MYCSSACRQRAYRRRGVDSPTPVVAVAQPGKPLPAPLDSFVGRERDLAELASMLTRHRLVTLLGPGGAGKTRLALEHARRAPAAHWVELAALTDPALLARTVADSLDTGEEIGRPVVDTVVEALSGGPVLLVLDNCGHLVVHTARLAAELVRRCPELSVVATGGDTPELPGETVLRVDGLPLPRVATAAETRTSDAVRLFAERAAASDPEFELTDDNAHHVASICADLGGMPLAIELAARRVGPLMSSPRTDTGRHRDLRTTIEWSYDLLDAGEQAVFRRLSVLVGGFGLSTAAAVCADDVPDPLSGLEARSLIAPGRTGGRFRQLEPIRLYGLERLRDAGELDDTCDRLADHLLSLAEPIVGDRLPHRYEEFEPLDVERANLQALLDWTGRRGDRRHLALAAALSRCWQHHGHVSDGWTLLRAALDAAGPGHPDRSAALTVAAGVVVLGGDYPLAARLGAEAVRREEATGHPVRLVKALDALASVHVGGGRRELASQVARRALEVAPRLADPLDLAVCLHNQARHLFQSGHAEQAGELMERCLPLYREHSPHPMPPQWLHSAGMLALARDQVTVADRHFREALERHPRLGGVADLPITAIDSFEGLAAVAVRLGGPMRALRLDAIAEVARHDRKPRRDATVEQRRDATLATARAQLTPDEVREAERDGIALAARGAVEYAVGELWAAHRAPTSPLSDRQVELARLVAAGRTNQQIASRLRLTEQAVESSLRDIRRVLRLRSRAQLAAWSSEHVGES